MEEIPDIQTDRSPGLLEQLLELEDKWKSGRAQPSPEDLAAIIRMRRSDIGQPLVAALAELSV
jgi:hypothetical protein